MSEELKIVTFTPLNQNHKGITKTLENSKTNGMLGKGSNSFPRDEVLTVSAAPAPIQASPRTLYL